MNTRQLEMNEQRVDWSSGPEPGRDGQESRDDRQSDALKVTPRLSHRGLTLMLLGMCVIPVVTIFALQSMMPPVFEGELEAAVYAVGLPDPEIYELPYRERPQVTDSGDLIVSNQSDQDWTHLNIQINRHYQIHDVEPIPAHSQRTFKLDRFLSRTGARFQTRFNPLRSVRIYARRPTKDRATFNYEFDENGK